MKHIHTVDYTLEISDFIVCKFCLHKLLKKRKWSKSAETESRLVVARGFGEEAVRSDSFMGL